MIIFTVHRGDQGTVAPLGVWGTPGCETTFLHRLLKLTCGVHTDI